MVEMNKYEKGWEQFMSSTLVSPPKLMRKYEYVWETMKKAKLSLIIYISPFWKL